jgi:hypothetical protein
MSHSRKSYGHKQYPTDVIGLKWVSLTLKIYKTTYIPVLIRHNFSRTSILAPLILFKKIIFVIRLINKLPATALSDTAANTHGEIFLLQGT